ncbi:flagellar biosynthesis protein FliQ [Oscillospiraceae bacterium OttesenSCG-928-G22]|nr:flagellar biosynthesis protein FliQ [Oscillospiraceae bacterium OttesenSCG-928-G22]
MTQAEIAGIIQDAIRTILTASLPLLGIGLVVGLIISIIQATTQINEQTIVFVSKIISVFTGLLLFGPFILNTLSEFMLRIFSYIGGMG